MRKAAPHGLCVVLPVSGIARGKSRLSPVLSPQARARLNRRLVTHAVGVAVNAMGMPARCIVVSPCERSLLIARRFGAVALREPRPSQGLNAAVRLAMGHAVRQGARRVLVLPADLPRLSTADVRLVLHRCAGMRSLVVPDREQEGTNALLLSAHRPADVHFGADSYARHCRAARDDGSIPRLLELPALRQDLDTPDHLAAWEIQGTCWGR